MYCKNFVWIKKNNTAVQYRSITNGGQVCILSERGKEWSSEDALIIYLHWKGPRIQPFYSVTLLAESLPADIQSYLIKKTVNSAVLLDEIYVQIRTYSYQSD